MENKFLSFLEQGLSQSDSGLGDRSTYIGASDVGQCMRKAYLSKKVGEKHDLKQLLIFERGHVGEGVIEKALQTQKLKYKSQVEVSGQDELYFIKTHIDFEVSFKKEEVVIECKTSNIIPEYPRESWLLQTQVQIGLLATKTRKRVRGIIAAMNLNSGEAKEWNVEFDPILFNVAIDRAKELWKHLEENNEPEGEVSDLCAFCSFKGNCPSLRAKGEELPKELLELVEQIRAFRSFEKKTKEAKENVKAFMEAAGIKKATLEDMTLELKYFRKESLYAEALKKNYPDIAAEITSRSEPYSALYIK